MTEAPPRFAFPAPRQITLALDAGGLEGPDVDRACGVEEPVVDLWESGVLVPDRDQVAKLSVLTGAAVEFFYERVQVPAGRMFICGRRQADRAVIEPGELGSPVCPGCGVVCWLKVPAKTGGVVLLEGPDVNGSLIMCVVGRAGRGASRRLEWGVRSASREDRRDAPHLLRAPHVCHGTGHGARGPDSDRGLFTRPS